MVADMTAETAPEARSIVRWMTAFVDRPTERVEDGARFWQRVLGSQRSPSRGDRDEFATLLPPDGDAFVRVQQVIDGGGVHLDLHVDDVAEASTIAVALGATTVADHGYRVMRSPGGMEFCLVPHHGEETRPASVEISQDRWRLDQMAIDVPSGSFETEVTFWSALTCWPAVAGNRAEFAVLTRPPNMPLRLLLQRLGDGNHGRRATAHLDVASGRDRHRAVALFEQWGATVVVTHERWTTMRDPSGFPFCVTERSPDSGLLE
jgi:hypothetical protein